MLVALFGIILCVVILYLLIKYVKDKNNHTYDCSIPMTGLVTSVDVCTSEDLGKTGDALWYKPVIKITLNDKDYILEPKTYTDLRQFNLGDNVSIMVNPDNPYDFEYREEVNRDYKGKVNDFKDLVKSQLK